MSNLDNDLAADALRLELAKRYHLRESYFTIDGVGGPRDLRFYSVRSIDDILGQATDEDTIPFWAEIWDSALGLAKFLAHDNEAGTQTMSMLELGCGVGVVGISASIQGFVVSQVDYSQEALLFARLNAIINGVGNIEPAYGDIRDLNLGKRFDRITGADILYEPKLHPYIVDVMGKHLMPDGKVLFSDPGRAWASDFVELAVSKGWIWDIDEVKLKVEAKAGYKTIDILTFYRGDQK